MSVVKKQKIPATLRNSIWNNFIGSETKTGNCFCCNTETISVANFECGHILSEKDGGLLTLENLRPICSLCNKSMGIQNMEIFMNKYGYTKNKLWNGIKTEENNILKTKLNKINKDFLDNLNFLELKIISKELNITDKTKNKIIDNLIKLEFNYNDWYYKYLDNFTNDKLNMICKFLNNSLKKSKIRTIEMLLDKNIQIYLIENIINENKSNKYYIECLGDKSKSCIHCIKTNDILIQCEKCNNKHILSINDKSYLDASDITIHTNYYYCSNVTCNKCNNKTNQLIYNNPFYNFMNESDKLNFNEKSILVNNNTNEIIKFEKETSKEISEIELLKNKLIEMEKKIEILNLQLNKFIVTENYLKLEFNEPLKRCKGEYKSKLLLETSKLYKYLHNLKKIIRENNYNHNDRMDLHIEVLNNENESIEEFLKRVNELEGKEINIADPRNYIVNNSSISLMIGRIENYKKIIKITIAFFESKFNIDDVYILLLKNI